MSVKEMSLQLLSVSRSRTALTINVLIGVALGVTLAYNMSVHPEFLREIPNEFLRAIACLAAMTILVMSANHFLFEGEITTAQLFERTLGFAGSMLLTFVPLLALF